MANPYDPTNPNGLINSTVPSVGTNATGDKTPVLNTPPVLGVGDRTLGANETVAGQFNNLTSKDNPLMTMGRTMAKQQMNGKGLLNSSMAIGAADAAAYQTALPIAQADAAANKAAGDMSYQSKYDASKTNLSAWMDTAKTNMDANTKTSLGNIEAKYKILMGANSTAMDTYSKAMQNIADISNSADLDAVAKSNAINTQLQVLDSSMQLLSKINGLNYGDLLNFNYNSGTGGVTNTGTAG